MGCLMSAIAGTIAALSLSLGATLIDSAAKGGEKDVIEEVDSVEVVASTAADAKGAEQQGFSAGQAVGRTHPVWVHLPLGFVFAVCLIEFLSFFFLKLPLGKSGLVLSIAAVCSFVPAMISGVYRAGEMYGGGAPPEILNEHRLLIMIAAAIFIASLILRLVKKDELKAGFRYAYLGLLFISAAIFASGGHHGGMLVYGENFFPF